MGQGKALDEVGIEKLKSNVDVLNTRVDNLHKLVIAALEKVGLGGLQNLVDILHGEDIKHSTVMPPYCHKHG